MNQVHVNGVALLSGIDYTFGQSTLVFTEPPGPGEKIVLTQVIDINTGSTQQTTLTGDGYSYIFKINSGPTDREILSRLFEKVIKNQKHPAVKEALDRLKVIVELIND